MGNALKCFRGEGGGGRRGQGARHFQLHEAAAQLGIEPHEIEAILMRCSAMIEAEDSNTGHQQRSNGARGSGVVDYNRSQSNTEEDIDESSAEGLCSATSYAKANPLLIQVPVLGRTPAKKFWRLSDKAARITRKLVLILRSHHAVGKHLAAPLQLSNVWIGSAAGGSVVVKLRGVSFTAKGFSVERVRDDYKQLSRLLLAIIRVSGGDAAIARLPPDYREFLALLGSDTLAMDDEFLIANHAALLPMKNRTEVFLTLHDRIVKHLGRTDRAKKGRILAGLPYESDWLETARANARINQWVVNVQHHEYRRTQSDLLRLNRNVRSHRQEYDDDDAGDGIEEVLYCEWPELLMAMVKMLHLEGELQATDIENKFG